MAKRTKNRLTAAMVKQASKPGYLSDGNGLVLQTTSSGAKSWLFRYRAPATGRVREMGLGSVAAVSLAEARRRADEAQRLRSAGQDPLEVKRQGEARAIADAAKNRTFQWCAERYMEANQHGWRNAKHAKQWAATLKTYAYPVFQNVPVADIDQALILQVLEPLWVTKHETATRLRQRIELVLSWATGTHRHGENPARWRGNLEHKLLSSSDLRKTKPIKHHSALPADEIPALMSDLSNREGGSALALRFLALTATRTGEVIGALWSEIDLEAKVWTIPANRMKANKEHRAPLSGPALDILRAAATVRINDVVFCGPVPGRAMSNMAFAALLKRMKRTDFVPHGLRSTFRTWAAERTNYPREVCEMALAHTVGDATERAYQRGDMFERRRRLMNDWAKFATAPAAKTTGDGAAVLQFGQPGSSVG